nr:MAG TPA: hypothetical protein [Caudoviricetes sp.]
MVLFLNKQKCTHYKDTFLACSTEVVNLCQFSYELLVFSYNAQTISSSHICESHSFRVT